LGDWAAENKDKLLQGNLGELWEKVKDASKSGNAYDIKSFIQEQTYKIEKTSVSEGGSQAMDSHWG
jgi:hypothetical protein